MPRSVAQTHFCTPGSEVFFHDLRYVDRRFVRAVAILKGSLRNGQRQPAYGNRRMKITIFRSAPASRPPTRPNWRKLSKRITLPHRTSRNKHQTSSPTPVSPQTLKQPNNDSPTLLRATPLQGTHWLYRCCQSAVTRHVTATWTEPWPSVPNGCTQLMVQASNPDLYIQAAARGRSVSIFELPRTTHKCDSNTQTRESLSGIARVEFHTL